MSSRTKRGVDAAHTLRVRVDAATWAWLGEQAAAREASRSDVAREAIAKARRGSRSRGGYVRSLIPKEKT